MANDYFNHVNNRLTGLTRALASSVNNIADEIVQGFDKIPSEAEIRGDTTNLGTNIGTANEMVVNLASTPSLADGYRIRIKSPAGNTGSTTLNLNNLGVKNVVNSDLSSLTPGAIVAGSTNGYYYDQPNDRWVLETNNSAWGKPETSPVENDPNIYCPGYPYTFVDTTTWRITGYDATKIFRVNRRLKFSDVSDDYFGAITAVDFGVTSAGDTTITMSMEGGDVLTNTITAVCLTNSDVGNWSEIGSDPFGGDPIYDITAGVIGVSTVYWVAVGANGKLFTSTDKGANWIQRTTGTSEPIYGVAYDNINKRFMAVGGAGIILTSTTGTSWTLDTTTFPTFVDGLGGTNPGYTIYDVAFGAVEEVFWMVFEWRDLPPADHYTAWTLDFGATFTNRTRGGDGGATWRPSCLVFPTTDGNNSAMYTGGSPGSWSTYSGTSDSSATSITDLLAGSNTMLRGYRRPTAFGGTWQLIFGDSLGELQYGGGGTDDVTFSKTIRDAATSFALDRCVVVADGGEIGYAGTLDLTNSVDDAFTFVANPFLPSSNIEAVHYDEDDAMFIAVADNGQICRSQLGT